MYMLSLKQAAGMGFDEKESLESITAWLVSFLQMKSQRLYRHSLQVTNYSVSIAAKLGLPKSEIELIKYASLLHDIGKVTLSGTLLAKAPYLNRTEKPPTAAMPKRAATCWKISPAVTTSSLT